MPELNQTLQVETRMEISIKTNPNPQSQNEK